MAIKVAVDVCTCRIQNKSNLKSEQFKWFKQVTQINRSTVGALGRFEFQRCAGLNPIHYL